MKKLIMMSALVLSLGACANARDTRLTEGALLGGTGGAIIGGVATGTGGGALVGGLVGGTVGAVVADATRPRHRRTRCYYNEMLGHNVCRYR